MLLCIRVTRLAHGWSRIKLTFCNGQRCSLDQNPIENNWEIMVRKVFAKNKQCDAVSDIKLAAFWSISKEVCLYLVQIIPSRIFEPIQKNAYTHYEGDKLSDI